MGLVKNRALGRVLIVAGSDSSGGAGVQADIKTVTMLGGYAATAIIAVTVQDTLGVQAIHDIPVDIIRGQMRAVLEDIGADAIKTGMLHTVQVIEAVAEEIDAHTEDLPLVVDPVMRAKGGAALLEPEAVAALKKILLPMATLITPNIPEAALLSDMFIDDVDSQRRAGERLLALGCEAVLIKGGHAPGDMIHDVLVTQASVQVMSSPRIDTPHTHGTGCTLGSAIATLMAQGMALEAAVAEARGYVHEAIRTAPGFGKGHGPLNHMHPLDRLDGE